MKNTDSQIAPKPTLILRIKEKSESLFFHFETVKFIHCSSLVTSLKVEFVNSGKWKKSHLNKEETRYEYYEGPYLNATLLEKKDQVILSIGDSSLILHENNNGQVKIKYEGNRSQASKAWKMSDQLFSVPSKRVSALMRKALGIKHRTPAYESNSSFSHREGFWNLLLSGATLKDLIEFCFVSIVAIGVFSINYDYLKAGFVFLLLPIPLGILQVIRGNQDIFILRAVMQAFLGFVFIGVALVNQA